MPVCETSVSPCKPGVNGSGDGFTVTVLSLQPPGDVQPPSPRTKYLVVLKGVTIIKFPVSTFVPPHESVYQCQLVAEFKLPPMIVNVSLSLEHIVDFDTNTFAGLALMQGFK